MNPEVVFAPKKSAHDNPTPIYALKMALVTLGASIHLLWDSSFHNASIPLADRHIKRFGENLLKASHTTVEVQGRSQINFSQSYVYMSNHFSLLDIPVLFEAIPQSLRMVSKAELFQVPIFGRALLRSGFIRIDRRNRQKAISQLEIAKERLREGVSVWISPEGTRSRTDELGSFKKGGFHIATGLGVPIIPIWIEGASKVIHPDSISVSPNRKVTVYFGTPIETTGLGRENLDDLMKQVREAMLQLKPGNHTTASNSPDPAL